MSQHDAESTGAGSDEPTRTSHPAVDSVLDSLARLEELPEDEHVAVYEQAHERLRRTLAEAGEPDGPDETA